MKSLSLICKKNSIGLYEVYLNRGRVNTFSSKRKAQDFIRLFQSNTNDCLRSLNHIMADIYKKYLDFYFYLDPLICEKIKYHVNTYNDRIDYFFRSFEYGNQSFKLKAFYCLFDNVDDIINLINSFAKKSKNYQLVNSLNSHLKTKSILLDHFNTTLTNNNLSKQYKTNVIKLVYKNSISING